MVINFVGLFSQTGSGEVSDETHLARSMEELGHIVRRIPRDEWREYVIENAPDGKYRNVPNDLGADINIVAKWHHFYDGSFINILRGLSNAPCFYWCWDSVDLGIEWHRKMAQAADLYLSGELGRANEFRKHGIRFYYLQMDVVDGDIGVMTVARERKYNVTYLGTCDNQNGRVDLLKAINKEVPITVFGQNFEEWKKQGFDAYPAVYGLNANRVIAESKIVLGTSCDPHLYGYWSNRVGRIIRTGGRLLQQYTPGMENFIHDFVEYFSTAEEAIDKINNRQENKGRADKYLFTGHSKVKDLLIMAERYLKENNGKDWILP